MSWKKGNKKDGRHYWLVPPDLYAELNAEFQFDYDPCPFPLPAGYNGLAAEWGLRNWVNPPFGAVQDPRTGKDVGMTAWVKKAIEEHRKGKLVVMIVMLYHWHILLMLEAAGSDRIRYLGDVKWCATEDGSSGPGAGHTALFVMVPEVYATDICPTPIVFQPWNKKQTELFS
jgi:hypothetical protein